MITADGERSRKRIPHAKKALATITQISLPAKASMIDGFTYKVWQHGKNGLSGGRVTSPYGIYVAYLGAAGFKQFVCDSAQCTALPIYNQITGGRYFTVQGAAPDSYSTYVTGGADGVPIPADTAVVVEATQWKPPQPVCVPFGGEAIAINATYERPSGHWIDCSLATHCYSDGKTEVQSHGISGIAPIVAPAGLSSHRVIPLLTQQGYMERLLWKQAVPYYSTGLSGQPAIFVEYQYYYAPSKISGVGLRVTGTEVFAGATAAFRAKLAYHETTAPLLAHSHGHFGSRTATDVVGVVAVRVYNYSTEGCTAGQIADPNHSCIDYAVDSNWLLTLTFYSALSGTQVVGYDALNPALDTLASSEFAWVYPGATYEASPEKQSWVLRRLFGYGADDETVAVGVVPRDTATFADAAGVVYSWIRCCDPVATQRVGESSPAAKLGGFKFTPVTGWARVPLVMPPEVLTNTAIRPRIILMTAATYHCITDTADGNISGLYVGSPLSAWEQVPLPADVEMKVIRVVHPSDLPDQTGFIGIGKETAGTAPDEVVRYRVYLKLAGTPWVALSPIPVETVNDLAASWDVCVFGDDALVQQSQQVKQHPIAMQSRRPELR